MAKRSAQTNRIFDRVENPIDHTIDLGFVNYVAHPENKNYTIFRFADHERADSFRQALTEGLFWFEESKEDKRGRMYVLFAVHNSDFKKVSQINYDVEAKHRKLIISSKPIRLILFGFSLIVMTLTIIGYVKSKNKPVESANQKVQSIK